MLNEQGQIIYVGKAKNLRRRLGQYRNARRCKRHRKMKAIVAEACAIAYEICPSELDASLLESAMIRELRPRWNVAGAFHFLYPMLGIQAHADTVLLAYTTTPGGFGSFDLHGAYRSRGITGDAFFALTRLLPYILHPIPPDKLLGPHWREKRTKGTYLFGFRVGLERGFGADSWAKFFSGRKHGALEDLSVALLDHSAACKS